MLLSFFTRMFALLSLWEAAGSSLDPNGSPTLNNGSGLDPDGRS